MKVDFIDLTRQNSILYKKFEEKFENAERFTHEHLALSFYPDIKDEEVRFVASKIGSFLKKYEAY